MAAFLKQIFSSDTSMIVLMMLLFTWSSDLWRQLYLTSKVNSGTVSWDRKWLVTFNGRKTYFLSFDCSSNNDVIESVTFQIENRNLTYTRNKMMSGFYMKCNTGNTKIDWSDLKEKIFLRCWDCYGFFKFNCGSYIIFINKTSFKNSWFNSFQVSFFKDFALSLCHAWACIPYYHWICWISYKNKSCTCCLSCILDSLSKCDHPRSVCYLLLHLFILFI